MGSNYFAPYACQLYAGYGYRNLPPQIHPPW